MACGYSTVTQRATHYLRSDKSLRRTLFLNITFACGRNIPKTVRCHPQGRPPYSSINTEKSEATIVMRLSLGSCQAYVLQHGKSPDPNYLRTFTLNKSRRGPITSNTSHRLSSRGTAARKFLVIRAQRRTSRRNSDRSRAHC